MEANARSQWNKIANNFLAEAPRAKEQYYLKEAYKKATELGLKRVSKKKISLLKLDLWNEAVGVQRELLAQYAGNPDFSVFGIDISRPVCSGAKSNLSGIHVSQASIVGLPFKDNSFDILLDISTLDHVPWNQAQKALKEYSRVLKTNGILVLAFWYECFAVNHIRHDRENSTQYYFSLNEAKKKAKERFDFLEEFCIHSLSIVPKRIQSLLKPPKLFLDLLLRLEYSRFSKFLLKEFSGIYVIIGKNKKPIEKITANQIIEFWEKRSRLVCDPLGKVLWIDMPAWNRYVDGLQNHFLQPVMSKMKPTGIVLDVGCGAGRFSFRLAKFCGKIHGIDSSSESIRFAKEAAKRQSVQNAEFSVMDARKLDFADNSFDFVYSVACVSQLAREKDFTAGVKELFRVVKQNGRIILLENTSCGSNYVSMPKEWWLEKIKECGGKIDYWCGIDVPFLRKLVFGFFGMVCGLITRKEWKTNGNIPKTEAEILGLLEKQSKANKLIENIVLTFLTAFLKPFEYVIPRVFRKQSKYILVEISKQK